MKKHGGIIDEDAIGDLIKYAEDEESSDMPDVPKPTDVLEEKPDIGEANQESKEESVLDNAETPLAEPDTPHREYIQENDGPEELVFEEKKYAKRGVVIGIIIGIIAIIVFITVDTGIIGNYKQNFSNNFSNMFANFKTEKQEKIKETPKPNAQYITEISGSSMVSFDGANNTQFAVYRGGIIAAKMNYMSYFNEAGTLVWETDTAIVDPILKTEGNYILLAEKDRNKICLYNDKNLVYDIDDPDKIMSAELSENGDVVVVTDKSSYKGGISVYNKAGAQIYSWSSGSDTVMCADISPSSRRVAAALLNTDETAKTIIQIFDLNETESCAKVELGDTVVYDVRFTDDTVTAFGDTRLTGISAKGKLLYDNTFEGAQLTHSAIDDKGSALLSFDDGNVPMINLYKKNGALRADLTLTGVTDFVDINGDRIIYNIGRDIYFGAALSKQMCKYTAAMDIKNLCILSDNAFAVIYSNSLEFITW